MGQTGWRLPDDLLKRVRVHCAQTGERQNAFVERALEKALAVQGHVTGAAETPAPPRVPAKSDPPSERELQGVRNVMETTLDTMQEVAANRRRNRIVPVDAAPRLGKGFVPPRPKGT